MMMMMAPSISKTFKGASSSNKKLPNKVLHLINAFKALSFTTVVRLATYYGGQAGLELTFLAFHL